MTNPYTFTDNPTESGVAVCNTDILNDDIMYLKWELSNSPAANTDLSNITSTGKTKVVTLAHELDWANAITVSTTSSNSIQTYTCPSDGVLIIQARIDSGTTKTIQAYIYDSTETDIIIDNHLNNISNVASICLSSSFAYFKNEVAHYKALYSGGTGSVKFIPFKKS